MSYKSSREPTPTLTNIEAVWFVAPKVLKLISEGNGDMNMAKLKLDAAKACYQSGEWKVTLLTSSDEPITFDQPGENLLPGTWILSESRLEIRPHDEHAWKIWARAQGDSEAIWANIKESTPPMGTPCESEQTGDMDSPQQESK